jgi:hypothetical protein
MHGKKALQTPIDIPPDMHGKKALQTPIDTPPDMQSKKALQAPIDPPPPDMRGGNIPQHPIDTTFSSKGLQNVPPMQATPTMQQILEREKKLATDGLPEQTLIHGETLHQEVPAANEIKLLDASRKLAEAMQKLSATACAIDTSKSSPSAKAAVVLIDTSVREFKKDVKNISLLDAASELIIGMKLLAKACSDELPLTEKSEIEQNTSPELRASIFKILQNAHRQYIKDHDLLNPGSNLFGRTPGKEEMRAEILARFIDALINIKSLNPEIVDKEFAKLTKDADLKYAFGGIESEMKACLTGMKAPEPKPAPSNKLDDVD